MININETHDQNLKSWVESANDPNTDFPIQNLPFGCFQMTTLSDFGRKMTERLKNFTGSESDLKEASRMMMADVKVGDSLDDILKNFGFSLSEGESFKDIIDMDRSEMSEAKILEIMKDKVLNLDMYKRGFGVAIGDQVFDLQRYMAEGHMDEVLEALTFSKLLANDDIERQTLIIKKTIFGLSGMGSIIRKELVRVFNENADEETQKKIQGFLIPMSDLEMVPNNDIKNYTDFYCSIFHATNVGKIFRPDNPLLPNYKYIPIGYHGRASSIVPTGTDIKRPKGQNRSDTEKPPVYIPSKALDYEMEVGFFVGKGTQMGDTIPLEKAEEHIFGLCLVNDWSARDVQGWEAQPLGPFLGKSFATTISSFAVTMEALAPFRVPAFERPDEDPEPLDYLSDETNEKTGGIDLKLEVYIQTKKMRDENVEPHLLSRSNLKDLYWTIGQMLTHHASNGCNLQTGDLMASGTVSGKEDDERGCLLEITKRGKEPIELPNGEVRRFLEDYDEIIMKGFCEREGFRRIGFGECRGMVLPSD